MKTPSEYRILADVARSDLSVSPRDWGAGARNVMRAAVEVFDMLAMGARIVHPEHANTEASKIAAMNEVAK